MAKEQRDATGATAALVDEVDSNVAKAVDGNGRFKVWEGVELGFLGAPVKRLPAAGEPRDVGGRRAIRPVRRERYVGRESGGGEFGAQGANRRVGDVDCKGCNGHHVTVNLASMRCHAQAREINYSGGC